MIVPASAEEKIEEIDDTSEITEIVYITQEEMDKINIALFGADFKRVRRELYEYPAKTITSYGSCNGGSTYALAAGMAGSLISFDNPLPALLGFTAAIYQRVSFGTNLYYALTRTQSRVGGVTKLKAKIDVYRNSNYTAWVYGTTLNREFTIND